MEIDKKQLNISKNYAEALFRIGKEQNDNEKLYSQLADVVKIIDNSNDLKTYFENPLISANDKKEIIYKVLGKDFDLQIINLLNLLADNKRLKLIGTVFYCYENLYEKQNDISKITVVSAIEMNEETKSRLKEKLENKLNKKIVPEYKTDKAIIGGLVIKIQDKIIDLSINKKIKDMEKQLI